MKVCLWWSLAASIILAGCGQSAPQDEAWILLDGEWWRVYQIGADEMRLSQTPGDNGITLPDTRKGIRRVTHTRETWAALVKAERAKVK